MTNDQIKAVKRWLEGMLPKSIPVILDGEPEPIVPVKRGMGRIYLGAIQPVGGTTERRKEYNSANQKIQETLIDRKTVGVTLRVECYENAILSGEILGRLALKMKRRSRLAELRASGLVLVESGQINLVDFSVGTRAIETGELEFTLAYNETDTDFEVSPEYDNGDWFNIVEDPTYAGEST